MDVEGLSLAFQIGAWVCGAIVIIGGWRVAVVQGRINRDVREFEDVVHAPVKGHLANLKETCAAIRTRSDGLNAGEDWSEEFYTHMGAVAMDLTRISICLADAQTLDITDRGWGWKNIVDDLKDDISADLSSLAECTDPSEARLLSESALVRIERCRGEVNNFILDFKRRQQERLNPFKRH